jgi:hypothetical protein
MKLIFTKFILILVFLASFQSTKSQQNYYIRNFNYLMNSSFKMNEFHTDKLIIEISNKNTRNKLECFIACNKEPRCYTIELREVKRDVLYQCDFHEIIPNFYRDVDLSINSQIYVKKTPKRYFNQSCFDDNCEQDSGLSCKNGRCLCRENTQ